MDSRAVDGRNLAALQPHAQQVAFQRGGKTDNSPAKVLMTILLHVNIYYYRGSAKIPNHVHVLFIFYLGNYLYID